MAYALAFQTEISAVVKRKDPPALFVIETSPHYGQEHEPDSLEFPGTAGAELSPDAARHGSMAATRQMPTTTWYRKLVLSCGFHAALAILLVGFVTDEILIAGSQDTMTALLGDGSLDMNASGASDPVSMDATNVSLVTMVLPKPVPAMEVEQVAPVVIKEPVETVAPAEPAPVPVTEVAEVVPSEAPEILRVTPLQPTLDQNVVQPPSEAILQPVEDVEPVVAKPVEKLVAPEPDVETPAVHRPVVKMPAQEKPVMEKPKQQPAKTVPSPAKVAKTPTPKTASGRNGVNERTARSGVADGKNDGLKHADGNARGNASAEGNAAVSNYPGTVTSKLRRALRRQGRLRGEVHVQFVVASNGSVTGVDIGRSSGNAAVDKAGMDTVRRAAPFPPIPADAGRSNWAFNVPLAFGG
ncbi:TonB family protein [Phyllobacterium lublinensis]|uniref:TonB family protein n=1 Tax=Phyllobacterium lublinensis TaxID=2875708 RepID=UPI001CCC1F96|nr:energy transducer TonB [Phyllobacterium sp. 2063]MBZ9654427.1 TonB family protein [Phyllobacterium sp. 2063]